MPSATDLRRAYRHPRRTRTYQRGTLDVGVGVGFRPGVVFDLYDPAGNRLGWGRVTGPGDIELFDAASNRLGSIRPTFRAFTATGKGVSTRSIAQKVITAHPHWSHAEIKVEVLRQIKTPTNGGGVAT